MLFQQMLALIKRARTVAIFTFLYVLPIQTWASDGFFFGYGQSRYPWIQLRDIQRARNDVPRLQGEMLKRLNSFETIFGQIGVDIDLTKLQNDWPEVVNLSFAAEGAGIAMVTNPEQRELFSAALGAGLARLAFRGFPGEALYFEGALLVGGGIEQVARAHEAALEQGIPYQRNSILMEGLDLKARKTFALKEFRISLTGQTQETLYQRFGRARGSIGLRDWTHNWLGRFDMSHSFWNFHTLVGLHPLPSDVLPRTWDRVANSHAAKEFGSMFGAGLGFSVPLGGESKMAALGGYYSGAPGAELRFRLGKLNDLRLTSYMIAAGQGYRSLDRRIYSFHAYFGF